MAGFDLSKLGLKKFEQPKEAPDAGKSESVYKAVSESVSEPVAKPTDLKIGIKALAGAPATSQVRDVAVVPESPKAPDVFDLATTQSDPPPPSIIDSDDDAVEESTPEGMRAKLDRLDKMIIANSGVDQLSIDTARGYVQDIMVELKTHPEYRGVLVDSDVHNVMTFVRASMNLAQKTFIEVANKRTKSEAKKTSAKFDFSGLGDVSIEAKPVSKQQKQLAQTAEAGLDAFANLNIDSIVAKMKK